MAAALFALDLAELASVGVASAAAHGIPKEIIMASGMQARPLTEADQRLHRAVMSYQLSRVRAALAEGAFVDARGIGGSTPALIAAQVSAWDICLFLLEAGADPAAESEFGMTIPKALAQSRVAPGTTHYEAMQAVAALLKERGLFD